MNGVAKCVAVGTLVVFASVSSAQAFDVRSLLSPRGISPYGAVRMGQQFIYQQQQQRERAAAAVRRQYAIEQAQARRAALSQTKAGRAQLAREDKAERARQKRNEAIAGALIGAAVMGIMSSGGGSSASSRDEEDFYRRQRSGGGSSGSGGSMSAPPIHQNYNRCQGGAFYGC